MDISLIAIKKTIINILHRYHIVLFVVLVVGGLVIMVFYLNSILVQSSQSDGYTSTSNNATFDQATIDRIKQLRTVNENQSQLDFSGRSNPFIE